MENFLIESLFFLEQYAHKEIFKGLKMGWDPIGVLGSFLQKQDLGNIEVEVPEGAYLIHPHLISIGKGTVIEPGALIKGPCLIGRDCEIRQGAYLRGSVITGDRCILGHASEIKGSIFLDDVCAAHFNYVGDSILGNGVNLGAGVKLANLRLDKRSIFVTDGESRTSTNLKKMGAIIGDHAQIGCNAVTNPGTVVGKGAFCHPCRVICGYIPSKTIVK